MHGVAMGRINHRRGQGLRGSVSLMHQQSYACFFFNHKRQIVFGQRVKLPTTSSAVHERRLLSSGCLGASVKTQYHAI